MAVCESFACDQQAVMALVVEPYTVTSPERNLLKQVAVQAVVYSV